MGLFKRTPYGEADVEEAFAAGVLTGARAAFDTMEVTVAFEDDEARDAVVKGGSALEGMAEKIEADGIALDATIGRVDQLFERVESLEMLAGVKRVPDGTVFDQDSEEPKESEDVEGYARA